MLSEVLSTAYEPCPDPFNLADYVLQGDPDRIALKILGMPGLDLTKGDLRLRVARHAGALRARVPERGARVLMRLGNGLAFPITYLAAIWAGLIPVPASAALTVSEITRIAEAVDPALIVAEEGVSLPTHASPVIDVDTLSDGPAIDPIPASPDDPAYIVFTSGTSGRPRGVIHAHRAVWARRMMWTDWYGLERDDRLLHAGAFNWTYTLGTGLLDPWAAGATALIPTAGTPATALPGLLA
ncbi:MAG: class I adenylate-forming enzyme family protein, partial [Planctomycetota bacterium]